MKLSFVNRVLRCIPGCFEGRCIIHMKLTAKFGILVTVKILRNFATKVSSCKNLVPHKLFKISRYLAGKISSYVAMFHGISRVMPQVQSGLLCGRWKLFCNVFMHVKEKKDDQVRKVAGRFAGNVFAAMICGVKKLKIDRGASCCFHFVLILIDLSVGSRRL